MSEVVSLELLDELELGALKSLVKLAAEGNAGAAAGALTAVERLRKTRLAEIHKETMNRLSGSPVELAGYLGSLGTEQAEVEKRVGHKLKPAELAAWSKAQEDRLLEVRAVELGRMRRGESDVPKWASKRL